MWDRYDSKIMDDVKAEVERQVGLWGVQRHSTDRWFTILLEEVGEAARAANEMGKDPDRYAAEYYDEMVQVAAVAVSAIRAILLNRRHVD